VPHRPAGTAPATVNVSVNPSAPPNSGLIAGTFNGQLLLKTTTGDVVTIPVNVTVGAGMFVR